MKTTHGRSVETLKLSGTSGEARVHKILLFLCEWDYHARISRCQRKVWPARKLCAGGKNVLHSSLVYQNKIILPPLHIKLGLWRILMEMNRNGEEFKYLRRKFPQLSVTKLGKGFVGPQIFELLKIKTSSKSSMQWESSLGSLWRHNILVFGIF